MFLGICFRNLKNLKNAYETLLEGDLHFPESIELMQLKGKIEIEMGNHKIAQKTFKKIFDLEPENGEALLAFCNLLLRNKKFKKCIRFSEIAKQKFTKIKNESHLNIINCYIHLGNIERASQLIEVVN